MKARSRETAQTTGLIEQPQCNRAHRLSNKKFIFSEVTKLKTINNI
jgi:hypothetical protein